jgi:inhibitor of cysteine peptidase
MCDKPEKGYLSLLVLIVLLFMLSGCAFEMRLDANANGTQKEIQRGQVLFVTLDSNATTGYRWQVASIEPAVLRQVGEAEYKQSWAMPGMVGVGGTETFKFEAVSSGMAKLTLNYVRSWEKDIAPAKTFSVTITVR